MSSIFFFFLMIRRPPRSTLSSSSAASDVYKRQVLSVGTFDRAQRLAEFMDPPRAGEREVFSRTSSRNFSTFSGRFKGVPVSIVSTNMGVANIDFVVRECRAVVDGKMAIARLGTCGIISEEAALGSLTVAETAVMITRNPDGWRDGATAEKYNITQPVASDPELLSLIVQCATDNLPEGSSVAVGKNATACSFYSSQGRTGPHFADFNETLIDEKIRVEHPDCISLEMESFHLLDLAAVSVENSVVACACAIGLAHRPTNAFLEDSKKNAMEVAAGEAVLQALVQMSGITDPGAGTIWE
eukprot:TRINITY_DN7819_c0_g1_i3.p1 TRINITY_DN7819_c0_g1~~TRINITY_DN7819_c0_g1_i3.p1  ORF type:complete len:300 (+),score=70.40 TRINITY_DN7819_c0_g1_i3:70-969(+)